MGHHIAPSLGINVPVIRLRRKEFGEQIGAVQLGLFGPGAVLVGITLPLDEELNATPVATDASLREDALDLVGGVACSVDELRSRAIVGLGSAGEGGR